MTFYKSLVETQKTPIRFLARIAERDQRTVLGRTLSRLLEITGLSVENLDKLTASLVKKQMLYQPVSEENRWRIQACKELIAVRRENLRLDGFGQNEVEEMLDFLCVT